MTDQRCRTAEGTFGDGQQNPSPTRKHVGMTNDEVRMSNQRNPNVEHDASNPLVILLTPRGFLRISSLVIVWSLVLRTSSFAAAKG